MGMYVVLESIEGTSILGPANGCCVPLRPLNRELIQAEQGEKKHSMPPNSLPRDAGGERVTFNKDT
jgi:hypothetical protein